MLALPNRPGLPSTFGSLSAASIDHSAGSFSPLTWLGTIGYSVFLWHMPIIYVVNSFPTLQGLDPRTHAIRLTLYVVPLTLLVSVPYYLLVERPFMSSAKKPALQPVALQPTETSRANELPVTADQ